jgi:hypothetical protein
LNCTSQAPYQDQIFGSLSRLSPVKIKFKDMLYEACLGLIYTVI